MKEGGTRLEWPAAKAFAHGLAADLARRLPDAFTVNPSKAARRGKIYLDYLRNGRGATAIAAYSTRARPGATVSTPVAWDELEHVSLTRDFLNDPDSFLRHLAE